MTNAIGPHTFARWLSPPPPIMHRQVASHVRPGQDGVTQQRVGRWGTPFDARVVAEFPDSSLAQLASLAYSDLPGLGPVNVIWEGVPYTQYGQMFLVESYSLISLRRLPRLIGPGYDYLAGFEIVAAFRMIPIAIDELKP